MSRVAPRRDDLVTLRGYHSPQVVATVRLNTNESPFPAPADWQADLAAEVAGLDFNRYPDREATGLRQAIADLHGVTPQEIFCANGSNEVLQCLLLAFGGPGRRAAVFEPTYQLHSHIARLTMTEVVAGTRRADLLVDPGEADRLLSESRPEITFLCSPNNPTGRAETPELVAHVVAAAPGLAVVDEAYGQFAPWSATALRQGERRDGAAGEAAAGLVVVRTFSKTWAMAAARLGYCIADPEVVAGCEAVALPYHLSAVTQAAGRLALGYRDEMRRRVAVVAEERGRIAAALATLPVESWPSDANFILFRPLDRQATSVWSALLAQGVLIRDCSGWDGLSGCLRVTVGTPGENEIFLEALKEALA